jgi:hypothetical protein
MITTDIKMDLVSNSRELFMPDDKHNSIYESRTYICNIWNAHLYRCLLSPFLQNRKFDTDLFLNGRLEFFHLKFTDFL